MGTTRRLRGLLVVMTFIVGVLIMPGLLRATPIIGELDISGSVRFTAQAIDWQPLLGPPNGAFTVQNISTGYFGALVGTFGSALDLNAAFQPVGVPISLPGFLTFAAAPELIFDLQFIEPGTINPPFPFSPFDFIETPGPNTTITFTMRGLVTDSANPGEPSQWVGSWSALVAGQTRADILSIVSAGGFIDAPYSADIRAGTQPVPEPSTMLLLGSGLIGLAGFARKRFSK